MTRVQFREDDDVVAYVEALGENPNEVAKRAFEAEVRRLKAHEARRKLAKLGLPRVDGAEEIRRLRENERA
ncbi:MAG: hypothetical protein ACT4PT_08680 [Methanobacteriota archaeon]